MHAQKKIEGWLRERFQDHPHIYFGISGATLLFDALRLQPRDSVLFPAFLCPSLPAMAVQAGKRVIHLDVDPRTLHPPSAAIDAALSPLKPSRCALLIDHSFGYPFPDLARLRENHPDLLLIEDCARSLGISVHGRFPGEHSDWVLLSMYKTIQGPQHGGVLLTRSPLPLPPQPRVLTTLRERAATVAPLRRLYDFAQRRRGLLPLPSSAPQAPDWAPQYGSPSHLCLERFAAELDAFESRSAARSAIAAELAGRLEKIDNVECIRTAPDCQSAGHFVSFLMPDGPSRDRALIRLQRQGLFLSRTWDLLPADYRLFAETFPGGHAGAGKLRSRIAHIPVRLFLEPKALERLIAALQSRCILAQS